ncbi:MAG: hypothetical protein AAF824_08055 [Bacteroidota bacterium]
MKFTHFSTTLTPRNSFLLTFTFLAILSIIFSTPSHAENICCSIDQRGHITIKGKVEEQSSGAPFPRTIIVAKSGNTILDKIQTDTQGRFSLSIPVGDLSSSEFSLQVNVMDHIFIKENIRIQTEEILIQINGEVFVEDGIREEYKLPVHTLDRPKVGSVHTWMREQSGFRISG